VRNRIGPFKRTGIETRLSSRGNNVASTENEGVSLNVSPEEPEIKPANLEKASGTNRQKTDKTTRSTHLLDWGGIAFVGGKKTKSKSSEAVISWWTHPKS